MILLRLSLLASASLLITEIGALLDTSTVALPYGSFRGQVVGTTTQFLGMPFAAPPYVKLPFSPSPISWPVLHSTGERRFGFPEPPIPFSGIQDASNFGAPCPQQAQDFPSNFPLQFPRPTKNVSEDCTTNEFADPHTLAYEYIQVFSSMLYVPHLPGINHCRFFS